MKRSSKANQSNELGKFPNNDVSFRQEGRNLNSSIDMTLNQRSTRNFNFMKKSQSELKLQNFLHVKRFHDIPVLKKPKAVPQNLHPLVSNYNKIVKSQIAGLNTLTIQNMP